MASACHRRCTEPASSSEPASLGCAKDFDLRRPRNWAPWAFRDDGGPAGKKNLASLQTSLLISPFGRTARLSGLSGLSAQAGKKKIQVVKKSRLIILIDKNRTCEPLLFFSVFVGHGGKAGKAGKKSRAVRPNGDRLGGRFWRDAKSVFFTCSMAARARICKLRVWV